MRRTAVLSLGVVAALALPAGAAAKPTKQDRAQAAKECKQLRGSTEESREAFAALYRNLGACVSERAREQQAERRGARRSASRACREQRAQDATAFAERYRNLGACVAAKAERALRAEDREDREEIAAIANAAKRCAAEREAMGGEAFAQRYGTNHNRRNAFGKCVASKSHDDDDAADDGGAQS
jgi:hypothetical protein